MKQLISLLGYGWAVALSIVLFYTIIRAYFGINYSIEIYINGVGEAHIELIMFMIVIPTMCYGFYLRCKELRTKIPTEE